MNQILRAAATVSATYSGNWGTPCQQKLVVTFSNASTSALRQKRPLAALVDGVDISAETSPPVVTVVVADGRVYTVEEFAKTMVNVQAA